MEERRRKQIKRLEERRVINAGCLQDLIEKDNISERLKIHADRIHQTTMQIEKARRTVLTNEQNVEIKEKNSLKRKIKMMQEVYVEQIKEIMRQYVRMYTNLEELRKEREVQKYKKVILQIDEFSKILREQFIYIIKDRLQDMGMCRAVDYLAEEGQIWDMQEEAMGRVTTDDWYRGNLTAQFYSYQDSFLSQIRFPKYR